MVVELDNTAIDMLQKALGKTREHLANNEIERADFILESVNNSFNSWIDREESVNDNNL